MRVIELKARERTLVGYSWLRKVEIIFFCFRIILHQLLVQGLEPDLQDQLGLRPPPPLSLVRFRPDRPRQSELLRNLEEKNPQPPPHATTLKPYQLKTKGGEKTFIEPPAGQPPNDPKKLKRMKKKLDELNRKIRHARKKQDGMIHKRKFFEEGNRGP